MHRRHRASVSRCSALELPGLDVVGGPFLLVGPGRRDVGAVGVVASPGTGRGSPCPTGPWRCSGRGTSATRDRRSPCGQLLLLSIMYCARRVADRLHPQLRRGDLRLLELLNTAAPTPPAMRAMMARTTMISSSVKPGRSTRDPRRVPRPRRARASQARTRPRDRLCSSVPTLRHWILLTERSSACPEWVEEPRTR